MQAILSLPPIDLARLPYHHYVCTFITKSAQVGAVYQFQYRGFKLPDVAALEYHSLQANHPSSQTSSVIHMCVQLVGGQSYRAFIDPAPLLSEPVMSIHFYLYCLDALQGELSRMLRSTPTDN